MSQNFIRHTFIVLAVLTAVTVQALAGDVTQTSKFKTCARDTTISLIEQAFKGGEIPPEPDGEMFVAIEPYTEKAYTACGSLVSPDQLKSDGLPSDEIQDFVNTAVFDYLHARAKSSH